MTSFAYDNYENYDEDSGEIDVEQIKSNIIRNMHHLIFCDLTVGRTDCGLEPYDSHQVNRFIDENHDNIEMAASSMFAAYEEDDDLHSLKNPLMDWFREFLVEFVNTRFQDEDEDDDDEHERTYIDEDDDDDDNLEHND